ncbi:MAG: hypothetical protein EU532_05595 [Promethearchaeota archaeon]|nr:MAG: hypothetical protein EU532_05595 [Candidatus Lokiarchaeota archaeon]
MSKKDELDEEELEILDELLFGSLKEENKIDLKKNKKSQKITKKSDLRQGIINIDKKSTPISSITLEQLKTKQADTKFPQEIQEYQKSKTKPKKRKIKKKQLLLDIAEIIPLIKQNNILLNELIRSYKSIEDSFKALTQEPIKIKFLK